MEHLATHTDRLLLRASRNTLWRTALLIEFALIYWCVWTTAGIIGYQLRHDGLYPQGCSAIPIAITIPEFLIYLALLSTILLLLAHRRWARYPHILITLALCWIAGDLLAMGLSDPPFLISTLFIIPAALASLTATILSFAPSTWLKKTHPSPCLSPAQP